MIVLSDFETTADFTVDPEIAGEYNFARTPVPFGVVQGAVTEEIFQGPASTMQAIDAYLIERETGQAPSGFIGRVLSSTFGRAGAFFLGEADTGVQGDLLTEEEFKQSEFFREGLDYLPGETTVSARIRAANYDREQYNSTVLSRSSNAQYAGAFVTTLPLGIAEPQSLALGIATTGASSAIAPLYAAGRAALSAGALRTAGAALQVGAYRTAGTALATEAAVAARTALATTAVSRGGQIAIIAGEATAATGLQVAGGVQLANLTADQYTVEDAFIELAASVLISSGIHVGASHIGRLWERNASDLNREQLSRIFTEQVIKNEPIDVQPLAQMQLAASRPLGLTTLTEAELAETPRVTKSGNEYFAEYSVERGIFTGVKGRGATPEEAIEALREFYNAPDVETLFGSPLPEAYRDLSATRNRLVALLEDFDPEAESLRIARDRGQDLSETDVLVNERSAAVDELSVRRREAEELRLSDDPLTVPARRAAEKEVRRLENRVGEITNRVRQTVPLDEGLVLRKSLEEDVARIEKEMVRMQIESVTPRFSEWVKRQTGPSSERPSLDPALRQPDRSVEPPKARAEPKAASEARKEIEDVLADETLDDQTRKFITDELDEIDALRQDVDHARKFVNCLRGL